MDFTTQIVIFLAFLAANVVATTFVIFRVYRTFDGILNRVNKALSEYETSTGTREWLRSMEEASEQAVRMTEVTKERMSEFDPALENFQARYEFMLAKLDTRIDRLSSGISQNAERVRTLLQARRKSLGLLRQVSKVRLASWLRPTARRLRISASPSGATSTLSTRYFPDHYDELSSPEHRGRDLLQPLILADRRFGGRLP